MDRTQSLLQDVDFVGHVQARARVEVRPGVLHGDHVRAVTGLHVGGRLGDQVVLGDGLDDHLHPELVAELLRLAPDLGIARRHEAVPLRVDDAGALARHRGLDRGGGVGAARGPAAGHRPHLGQGGGDDQGPSALEESAPRPLVQLWIAFKDFHELVVRHVSSVSVLSVSSRRLAPGRSTRLFSPPGGRI